MSGVADFRAGGERTRAGALALRMATDPANHELLHSMPAKPVRKGRLPVFDMLGEGALGKSVMDAIWGREGVSAVHAVAQWLYEAPDGPLELESGAGKRAVAALADGWETTIVHALAPGPRGADDLAREIDGLGRRALRRRLDALERSGLIEAGEDPAGEDTAYAVTDWLRAGLAPLVAAARAERQREFDGAAPIEALDVEAAFHLALPLLELPEELSGSCRLAVNLAAEGRPGLTGVTAEIDRGIIVSCRPGLEKRADASATGSAAEWLDTVIEPGAKLVRTGGDKWLTGAVLTHLHKALFGVRTG